MDGLTPVWWTGEYYRSSDLMWILLVLASTFVRAPCGARTFVPAHSSDTPARAGPVKIGRRRNGLPVLTQGRQQEARVCSGVRGEGSEVRCREVVLAGSLPAHDLLSLRCRMKPANGKPQRFKVI
jgi:hypothetical protein